MDRRTFLKTSAAAGAATFWGRTVFGAAEESPNYTVALVGTGWWGTNILREAIWSKRVKVVALCDVDESQLGKCAAEVQKLSGETPKHFKDFRQMLESAKPQIVICATPDHWHPLVTIAAVKAGAHVYVEKPISHTVKEGQAMVKAAREAGRTVVVGTHRRVSPHNVAGRDFIRSGKAGKIGMIKCYVNYPGGGPEQPEENAEPPKALDWDMWCGPGPLRPFNRKIHPKGFRQFLDYANGTTGDWGIHWLDQVLWIMDQKYPKSIYSTGGRPIKGKPVNDPQGQTTDAPDHQIAVYNFDGFDVYWEHRQFAGNQQDKSENVGCYFFGTNGVFHQGWKEGWTFYPSQGKKAPQHMDAQLHEPDQQNIRENWADFVAAIKENRRPISDIEAVHLSTNLALLGVLSMKLGRSIQWDGEKEQCVGDGEANTLLRREYRAPWKYPEV